MKLTKLFNPRQWTIAPKLIVMSTGLAVGSIAAIDLVVSGSTSKAFMEHEVVELESIMKSRGTALESYFDTIDSQLVNLAASPSTQEAAQAFQVSFQTLTEELGADANAASRVRQYYESEFRPRLEDAGGTWRGAQAMLPSLDDAVLLQAMYIADNANPVGSKHRLDVAPGVATYNAVHARFHPVFRQFLESFGFYDIFICDLDGNVVYTVFKEADYATNLKQGPYASSGLGRAFNAAVNATVGSVWTEDFAPYAASYDAPAAFLATPIEANGKRAGVLIFQAPVDRISAIMAETTGLGETGEVYLVGKDGMMRSNARLSETPTLLAQKVETEATKGAIAGQAGHLQTLSRRGDPAIAAFAPLDLPGLNWGIVAERDLSEATEAVGTLIRQTVIAGAMVSLVAAAIGLVLSLSISRPMRRMVDRIGTIVKTNDLTDRIQDRRADELGDLARSFNGLLEKLHQIIVEVAGSTEGVAAASTQIAASAEEMAAGMQRQSSQVAQISSAVEEMSASVNEVARKSNETATESRNSGDAAAEGGQIVRQTIEGMNAINDAVASSAQSVQELGKRGEQIGEIITVINDIADQTNLLALNAAIEAARAGEHGRGFAVVADEVRKLADRTTKATEEIAQSIKAIQQETSDAVHRMEAGTSHVKQGVERATRAGESLDQIVHSARQVAGMVNEIAAAAEEQSQASTEISRSIEEINAVASETSRGASESARAAAQLSAQAEGLLSLVGQFRVNRR